MGTHFRVVDLVSEAGTPRELLVPSARSPEDAARLAIGEILVRSGRREDLRAKVYFQHPEQPLSMVRLYRRQEDRP
mgnify:CR=1 FL=1